MHSASDRETKTRTHKAGRLYLGVTLLYVLDIHLRTIIDLSRWPPHDDTSRQVENLTIHLSNATHRETTVCILTCVPRWSGRE